MLAWKRLMPDFSTRLRVPGIRNTSSLRRSCRLRFHISRERLMECRLRLHSETWCNMMSQEIQLIRSGCSQSSERMFSIYSTSELYQSPHLSLYRTLRPSSSLLWFRKFQKPESHLRQTVSNQKSPQNLSAPPKILRDKSQITATQTSRNQLLHGNKVSLRRKLMMSMKNIAWSSLKVWFMIFNKRNRMNLKWTLSEII